MSGSTTTSPVPGTALSALPAQQNAPQGTDLVLAYVNGALSWVSFALAQSLSLPLAGGDVSGQIAVADAPSLPTHVVRQQDLVQALGNSNLGQYATQALNSSNKAVASQAAAQVSEGNAAQSAASAGTILSGVQSLHDTAALLNTSSQNALAGVTASANAASVLLTAVAAGYATPTYRGYWNAATNVPSLASGVGAEGDLWIVSTAGASTLDGTSRWGVGDGAWFHDGKWVFFARAGFAAVAQTLTALKSIGVGAAGGLDSGSLSYDWAMRDDEGFLRAVLDDDGFQFPGSAGIIGPSSLRIDDGAPAGGIRVLDQDGYVLSDTTGSFVVQPQAATTFTAAEIAAYDLQNKAFTASVDRQGFPTGQRPNAAYNLVISTGQSEQNGEMSLPILTKTQPYDNLMIGNSPRCADPNATTSGWQPVGGSWVFNPLLPSAWNQSTNTPITRDPALLNVVTPSGFTISADGTTITSSDSSVDFTKVFLATDTIQFTGFTGDASWMNIRAAPTGNDGGTTSWAGTSYVAIRSITANTIVLWVGGLAGTYSGVTIGLYSAKDPCLGEDQTTCSVNYERAYDWRRSPAQRLVCGNTCVGGQSLANLGKGASPDLYSRNVDLVSGYKSLCGQSSAVVYLITFGQGGSDTNTAYATYLSEMETYVSDLRADLMAITGQTQEPFFEWFVISGGNLPSVNDMSVPCAQVDAFRKGLITNGYCVGPGYWSPDYYAHWSSNGERWMGALRAKIRNWVVYQGRGWMPMHMRSVAWRGSTLLVNLHVPVGVVQFKPVWMGQIYGLIPDYGFNVYDASGNALSIASVVIASDTSILITLQDTPSSAPSVAYADWTQAGYGSGNVCDSDETQAFDDYIWADNTGQPFTEANAELQGKPYPLNNWLCPYYLTSEAA